MSGTSPTGHRHRLFHNLYDYPYDANTRVKLYSSAKDSKELVQRMSLLRRLSIHNGCVNTISWNQTGDLLLSGSDDQHLIITDGYKYKVLTDIKTTHRANIFSAKFLPNSSDRKVVSCSGDGIILYTDLEKQDQTMYNQFNCHSGTVYEIVTAPNDPHSFLSCGEDGTVRWFDLRVKDACNKADCNEDILIYCRWAVTSIAVSPLLPYQLAVGCSDSSVKIFDRRMLGTRATDGFSRNASDALLYRFTVPEFENRSYRITSLAYSPQGTDVLASYSSDYLYLFSVTNMENEPKCLKKSAGLFHKSMFKKKRTKVPPPLKRLRLRGDWSDTGPDARPEREARGGQTGEIAQARPTLHATLMQHMTNVLSRMLNDPSTRAALSGGGTEGQAGGDADQEPPPSPPSPLASTSSGHQEEGGSQRGALDLSTPPPPTSPPAPPQQEEEDRATEHMEVGDQADGAQPEGAGSRSEGTEGQQQGVDSLHDQLASMRENFIDMHNSEPAVSLTYSSKGSLSGLIAVTVANDVNQQPANSNSSPPAEPTPAAAFTPPPSAPTSEPASTPEAALPAPSMLPEFPPMEVDAAPSDPAPQSPSLAVSVTPPSPPAQPSCQESPTACLPGSSGKVSTAVQGSAAVRGFASGRQCSDSDTEGEDEDDDEGEEEEGQHEDGEPAYKSRVERGMHAMEQHMEEAIQKLRSGKKSSNDQKTVPQPRVKKKYTGHRNSRTMIKEATFWGDDFVLSGSDCGHVFVWDRHSTELVMLLEADRHVVNCLQPHPFEPILATSGIDYDVKLWAPVLEEPCFDRQLADVLTKRNEVMLEETRDTITVPASFMIRMLACLNQIRRGAGNRSRNEQEDQEDT